MRWVSDSHIKARRYTKETLKSWAWLHWLIDGWRKSGHILSEWFSQLMTWFYTGKNTMKVQRTPSKGMTANAYSFVTTEKLWSMERKITLRTVNLQLCRWSPFNVEQWMSCYIKIIVLFPERLKFIRFLTAFVEITGPSQHLCSNFLANFKHGFRARLRLVWYKPFQCCSI